MYIQIVMPDTVIQVMPTAAPYGHSIVAVCDKQTGASVRVAALSRLAYEALAYTLAGCPEGSPLELAAYELQALLDAESGGNADLRIVP